MYTPEDKYRRRVEAYGKKLSQYTSRSNALGNYKLLLFFAGIGLTVVFYVMKQYILMSAILTLIIAAFSYLYFKIE